MRWRRYWAGSGPELCWLTAPQKTNHHNKPKSWVTAFANFLDVNTLTMASWPISSYQNLTSAHELPEYLATGSSELVEAISIGSVPKYSWTQLAQSTTSRLLGLERCQVWDEWNIKKCTSNSFLSTREKRKQCLHCGVMGKLWSREKLELDK